MYDASALPDDETGRLMKLWAWGENTAAYWEKSLSDQYNEKGIAMVLISRDDCQKMRSAIEIIREAEALAREKEERPEEPSAPKLPEKGSNRLKEIMRRTKGRK